MRSWAIVVGSMAFAVPAQAAEPFEAPPGTVLGGIRPSIADEDRTAILVLATIHLSELGDVVTPGRLASLLEVLERYNPDMIAVEQLPGWVVRFMEGNPAYAGVIEQFAQPTVEHGRMAQRILGLTGLEAEVALDGLLDEGLHGTSAERRARLVLHLLAAYDPPSSALHWSSLTPAERRVAGDFTQELVTYLDGLVESRNEIYAIAVPLAHCLGLGRIESIDDHRDKDALMAIAPALMEQLAGRPELTQSRGAAVYAELERHKLAGGDLLPLYLYINSPHYQREDVIAQWDVFLRTRLTSRLDRSRLALWDVRNLNILSNLRRASARKPGGRMLVIIGAGHKPFLDVLLAQMLDVRPVQLSDLLKGQ